MRPQPIRPTRFNGQTIDYAAVVTLLLDNSDVERTIEIVATFSTVEDETPTVKSDLIRAAHTEFESRLGDHHENRRAVAKA